MQIMCRLHTVALRRAALVSDKKRIRGVRMLATMHYTNWQPLPLPFLVRSKTIVFGRTYVLCMMFLNFFSERKISEMYGPTGAKFCTMVSTRPNFIVPVQNFGGRTPKKFQGPKTCKIWPDFGQLRSSAANISETDEYIQNLIVIASIAIPPALGETSTVKFGPVTLEI